MVTNSEVLSALKTIKNYCEDNFCHECSLQNVCDDFFSLEIPPEDWKFNILPEDKDFRF